MRTIRPGAARRASCSAPSTVQPRQRARREDAERLLRRHLVPRRPHRQGRHRLPAATSYYNLFGAHTSSAPTSSTRIDDFIAGNYSRYRLAPAGHRLQPRQRRRAVRRCDQYGLFLQDTWQVDRPLFSMQYGLRFDLPRPPDPTFNPCVAAAPGTVGTLVRAGCGNAANPNAAVGVTASPTPARSAATASCSRACRSTTRSTPSA